MAARQTGMLGCYAAPQGHRLGWRAAAAPPAELASCAATTAARLPSPSCPHPAGPTPWDTAVSSDSSARAARAGRAGKLSCALGRRWAKPGALKGACPTELALHMAVAQTALAGHVLQMQGQWSA